MNRKKLPRAETIFAGFVALFTFLLVYLGWCQLRPYVELTSMVISYFDPTKAQSRVLITNTGNTPAYHVHARFWCGRGTQSTAENDLREAERHNPANPTRISDATIFHDAPAFGMNCEISKSLSAQDMEAVTKDDLRIVVWGTVTYNAIVLPKVSNFCFYLSGPYWKNQIWSQCTFHNDAD